MLFKAPVKNVEKQVIPNSEKFFLLWEEENKTQGFKSITSKEEALSFYADLLDKGFSVSIVKGVSVEVKKVTKIIYEF